MTATNHALTGAIIGLAVTNPLLALPLALGSHFVLDALPHYGSKDADKTYLATKRFQIILSIDIALSTVLAVVLLLAHPTNWLQAEACAVLATSPDLMWVDNYLRARRHLPLRPMNWLKRFHSLIQWYEKPPGALIELVWAAGAITILARLLKR